MIKVSIKSEVSPMGPSGDLTWNDPIELLSIKTYHAREGFCFRSMNQNCKSSFNEMLKMDKLVCIHYENAQYLAVEVYKARIKVLRL